MHSLSAYVFPMIDFGALLTSTTAAIGIAKAVREAKGEYDQAELRLKMAELLGTMADVKLALGDARDELAAKDAEIERLKAAFQYKGETVLYRSWHFPKTPGGRAFGKPFCPKCIEEKGRFVLTRADGSGYQEVFCPSCSTKYPNAPTLIELEEMTPEQRAAKD